MTKSLGRLFVKDDRDSNYPMRQLLKAAAVKTKYWVPGSVLDQGNEPQCVGYSWKQWLQSSPVRTKAPPVPDYIYFEAQKRDEWPGENYEGTSVRGAAKVLKAMGSIQSYYWATDVNDVIQFICNSGTVVVGTNWYNDMFNPDENGYLNPTGNIAGGHAYLLIGYSTKRNAFRMINSWGADWGHKGKAWIKVADFDRLLHEDGEACAAIETTY